MFFLILFIGFIYSSEWNIDFNSSDRTKYNIETELTLKWDENYEVIYLNYSNSSFYLYGNPGQLGASTKSGEKKGFAFYPTEDLVIANFSRYSKTMNDVLQVNLWRKDIIEGRPQLYFSGSVSGGAEWSGGLSGITTPEDFFLQSMYPLMQYTTYWIASVGDGVGNWGVISSVGSYGTTKIKMTNFDEGKTTPYFYDAVTEANTLSLINAGGLPQLEGVPDLKITQFDSYGVCITTGFDTKAKWIDYEGFIISLSSDMYKTTINEVGFTENNVYTIKFNPDFRGRIPEISVKLEFQDSDNGNFEESVWVSDMSLLSKRYIRWKMTLNTNNRGLTPVVDKITIRYNAHPEVSYSGYGISPSSGSIVTAPTPVFSWNNFYDADGDTLTYHYQLSKDTFFVSNIIVDSTTSNNSYSITTPLDDNTTYFWRILAFDINGASSTWSPTFYFKTSLTPFDLNSQSFVDGGRYIYSEIQTITLNFSKNVDILSFKDNVILKDENDNTFSYSFTPASGFSDTIYLQLPSLTKSKKYYISVSTGLKDFEGLNFISQKILSFLLLQEKENSFTTSLPNATLTIPDDSYSDNYFIEENFYLVDSSSSLKQSIDIAKGSAFIVPAASWTVSFIPTDSNGNMIETFSKEVEINLSYSDTDNDGYLDTTEIPLEEKLARVFYQDPSSSMWVLATENQTVDEVNNIITAKVNKIGSFTIMVYPSQVESQIQLRNIPNPFRAGNSTTITYYLSSPKDVKARIYTLWGEEVWKKDFPSGDSLGAHSGINSWSWNGVNNKGMLLSTGIYILEIDAGGKKIRRKIGVYR